MKATFTRMAALLLVVLMIVPLFASCDKKNGSTSNGKKSTDETEEYVGENGYVLAVNDYNGAKFTIATGGNTNIHTVEDSADTLDSAVYRRNEKVSELYDIDFDFPDSYGSDGFLSAVGASILSGADDYQLVGGLAGSMAFHTMSTGYYQNLLELPYLDFDQEWWPGEFMKNAKIGNNLFMAVGNMESVYYNLYTAILFNKDLAADYPIGDLYQLVRDGKWTLDKLIEYADMVKIDLDGDGIMDPKFDQFGLAIHRSYPVDGFVTAFDVQLTDFDEDGIPTLLPMSEHYVAVYDKLTSFVHSDSVRYNIEKSTEDYTFIEGRALFEANRMWVVSGYREMDQDFGILPYPKWDENQEQYRSFSDVENTVGYSIPITTNGERSANILEALSYFGKQIVYPAFYEKSLKGRSTRDKESGEMLDIIYSNVAYEFIQIYSLDFYPAPNQLLRIALWEDTNISGLYNRNRRMYESKMKELIEMLDVAGN